LEAFAFADDGSTWYRARPFCSRLDYHLASAGAGIRLLAGDKIRVEMQAANASQANAPGTRTGERRFLFGVTILQ
jgi:hypothetical protein